MPPRRNRNRRNREAVDPMANCVLPRKIIISILSRLPVKSLVRFKSVCKPWNTLFTNPEFIKLHYNRFSKLPKTWRGNSQILKCCNLGLMPHKKTVGGNKRKPDDFFLASCKGLICMGRPVVNTDRILLWNPATRLWKILPRPTTNHPGTAVPACLGFGCNEEGDDHKVVRIYCMKGHKMKVFVEVYSSKSDSWKPVNVRFPFRVLIIGQAAVVNGNPHWVVANEADDIVVLRLDATKMQFKALHVPVVMTDPMSMSFVNLEGLLGGVQFVKKEGDWLERIDVFVHENEEWAVKWRFEGEALGRLQVENCLEYSWRMGKIVGQCLNGRLFEYDVNEGSVRVFGVETGATGLIEMYEFEESLAHVRGMAAMDWAEEAAAAGKMKELILEGFFAWVMPRKAGEVEVYYPLAF